MSLETMPEEVQEETAGPTRSQSVVEPEGESPDSQPNFIRRFVESKKPTKDTPANLITALWPPVLGIAIFLALWAYLAPKVETTLGTLPGPVEVLRAGGDLYDEYQASNEAKAEFVRTAPAGTIYTGSPTFLDQIITSLQTVAAGFLVATLLAVPVGLMSGLSDKFRSAVSPLVQIFRPVSPVAWLPIVTYVVSAVVSSDSFLPKSFINAAMVVTLCSLWPTLLNTAVGAQSVDKDLLNVGEVLRLSPIQKLRRLILPSALPYIFTGMRISLGIGWMVLIAAELLAQNPGLGKFVWDEFQGGSSESIARIMFSVFVIGFIGFILDRIMGIAEKIVRTSQGV